MIRTSNPKIFSLKDLESRKDVNLDLYEAITQSGVFILSDIAIDPGQLTDLFEVIQIYCVSLISPRPCAIFSGFPWMRRI